MPPSTRDAEQSSDPARPRSEEFFDSWSVFDRVTNTLDELMQRWSQACDVGFDADVVTFADGSGEVSVHMLWDKVVADGLNDTARRFGGELSSALNHCVVAAAGVVSGVFQPPDPGSSAFLWLGRERLSSSPCGAGRWLVCARTRCK